MGKSDKGELFFGGLIGLIVLAAGLNWLANDLGWWTFDFPFWPLIVIVTGLGILSSVFNRKKKGWCW